MRANGSGDAVLPQPGAIVRQEFGGTQMQAAAETAATAVAKYSEAMVNMRAILAERHPRDMRKVEATLMREAERPAFADAAIWTRPVGDEELEGPSIRLAEAVVRLMGNVLCEVKVVWDDPEKRIIGVVVMDLETNATYADEVVFAKTVERRSPGDRQVISSRQNSRGQTVSLCVATEDELLLKQQSQVSRRIRTGALRLLPGDILEAVIQRCKDTLSALAMKDLPKYREGLVKGFAALNPPVTVEQLGTYLGKPLGEATAVELTGLKTVGAALRDNETSWGEVMSARLAQRAAAVSAPPPPVPQPTPSQPSASQPTTGQSALHSFPQVQPQASFQPVSDAEFEMAAASPPVPDAPASSPDPLTVEVTRLEKSIAEAQTKKELQGLTERIRALPKQDADRLKAVYTARAKGLTA